jgi:hypothetical protein
MGRRTQLPKYHLLTAVDSSTSPESEATEVGTVDFITYQFKLDPTVDANLEVHFCNDDRLLEDSIFSPLPFGIPMPLMGATDAEGLVHIVNGGFKWLKLVILDNGGSGNVDAWITGTVRGA